MHMFVVPIARGMEGTVFVERSSLQMGSGKDELLTQMLTLKRWLLFFLSSFFASSPESLTNQ